LPIFFANLYFTRLEWLYLIICPQLLTYKTCGPISTSFISLCSDFTSMSFRKLWLLNVWWSWSYCKNSGYKNGWIKKNEEKKSKGRTIFGSMHCYIPTSPRGQCRPKNEHQRVYIFFTFLKFWYTLLVVCVSFKKVTPQIWEYLRRKKMSL